MKVEVFIWLWIIYFIISFISAILAIIFYRSRFCWKCRKIEKIKVVGVINGFRLTCYHYKAVCKKCGKVLYDKWVNKYDYF